MAQNFIQDGDRITLVANANVTSGFGYPIGRNTGVCLQTALSGETVDVAVEGVFEMPKATGSSISVGDQLWWNNSTKKATKTASGNTWLGFCWEDAGNNDTFVKVSVEMQAIGTPANAVAKLGNTATTTAIAATYADLAAARTSVNSLQTQTEAGFVAVKAKVDALIDILVAAGVISAS